MRRACGSLVTALCSLLQITGTLVILRKLPVGIRNRGRIRCKLLKEVLIHRQAFLGILLVVDSGEGLIFGGSGRDDDLVNLSVNKTCCRK